MLLSRMTEKKTPFVYVDTHCGAGLYDLAGPESSKLGEAEVAQQQLRPPSRCCNRALAHSQTNAAVASIPTFSITRRSRAPSSCRRLHSSSKGSSALARKV